MVEPFEHEIEEVLIVLERTDSGLDVNGLGHANIEGIDGDQLLGDGIIRAIIDKFLVHLILNQ